MAGLGPDGALCSLSIETTQAAPDLEGKAKVAEGCEGCEDAADAQSQSCSEELS